MQTTITGVNIFLHQRETPLVPGTQAGTFGVLTIQTEGGVDGHAFVGGAGSVPEYAARTIAEIVRPQLIGSDALDVGMIWKRLWRQERTLGTVVIGSVDVALWDIAGKVAGLPVHRLLGTVRHSIPVYISSWLHERPEDYAAEVAHYRQAGYTGYKFHPPTQFRSRGGRDVPLSVDIETARLVREAAGPEMALMSDSPLVYTYEEALRFGRVLEELDFAWYEDPLPPDDIYGYERLRKQLRIPILATEMTGGGPFTYAEWVRRQATDYLRGDVAFKGGITSLMKIVHTAEAFGLGFEPHDGFNAVGNVAGANVTMAAPNAGWFEILTIQPTGVYGIDNFGYGLAEGLHVTDGVLHAPTRPGLGCTLDWDLLRAGTVAEF